MKPSLLIVVLVLLLGGIGVLIFFAAGGASTRIATVAQVLDGKLAGGEEGPGSGAAVRVRAKLAVQVRAIHKPFRPCEFDAIDIIAKEDDKTQQQHKISRTLRVVYDGHDNVKLEEWGHVSVEGAWDPQTRVFHADVLRTQCPSHYENQGPPPKPDAALAQP